MDPVLPETQGVLEKMQADSAEAVMGDGEGHSGLCKDHGDSAQSQLCWLGHCSPQGWSVAADSAYQG